MSNQQPPLILVTRFSVFSPKAGGLRIRQEFGADPKEFERMLFDPARLDTRLDILKNLALPSYSQIAKEFNLFHLVQYSKNLPAEYIDELHALGEQYEFLKPVEVEDSSMYDSVVDFLQKYEASFRGVFAWARVDDDDILSTSYFRTVKHYLSNEFVGMAISFPTQAATLYSNGLVADVRNQFVRNPSAGQTYVGRFNQSLHTVESIGFVAHHDVDKYVPTVVDPTVVGSLQMLHSTQDTSSFKTPIGGRLINRATQLSSYSEMDRELVAYEFPALLQRSRFAEYEKTDGFEIKPDELLNLAPDALREGRAYRLEFEFDASSKIQDGCSISFQFSNRNQADGHFPWTERRHHYLRLHADNSNSGSEFFVLPKGATLESIGLNIDRQGLHVDLVRLWLRESGPLDTA